MEGGDLNRMVWEGFSEEATLMNKGLKDGGEGVTPTYGRRVLPKGNGQCKGPEVGDTGTMKEQRGGQCSPSGWVRKERCAKDQMAPGLGGHEEDCALTLRRAGVTRELPSY